MYLVLGVLGNGTVLYLYSSKFKAYSKGRYLIPVLAVVDLVSIVTNCSMHLLATILLVMFESDIGCKVVCFLAVGTGVEGTLTLVLVAVERYKKICKPPGNQLTSTTKRTVTGSYTVFAVLMGSPFLYYSGVTTVDHDVKNVRVKYVPWFPGQWRTTPKWLV